MKIALGTAQFGASYGISNKEGKTSQTEAASVIAVAKSFGVSVIDTATLYGDSEAVLGRLLPPDEGCKIVTKTPQYSRQTISASDAQYLEDTFFESLSKLGRDSVYGLLIHNADDLLLPGGEVLVDRLLQLQKNGLAKKVGVSVYSGKQIDQVLERFPIDLIQLPINVLDQRLLQSGHLKKLKHAGVEIHARSAFLQGLLLMALHEVPEYFAGIRKHLELFHQFIKEQGLAPLRAALGFVASIPEIDQVVCGANNAWQFREICEAAQTEIEPEMFSRVAVADETMVNPSLWQLDKGKR